MSHKEYKVKAGDCISSIAFKHGLFPDTVWLDSKNADLKQLREDPNMLKPGDIVQVKLIEKKEESCATEARHRFVKKGVPEKLILVFKIDDEPRGEESYILKVDGVTSEGQTDADGKVEISIPPDAKKGSITFTVTGDEYNLQLGHLDPFDAISGAQGCLKNLGYYKGRVGGEMNDDFFAAIKHFQKDNDLEVSGELDAQTKDKLKGSYS